MLHPPLDADDGISEVIGSGGGRGRKSAALSTFERKAPILHSQARASKLGARGRRSNLSGLYRKMKVKIGRDGQI